ncbi:hypothetical protein [Methanobrevibacter sp.]|uniref:hypothetical protein n=1 Tax=Methanobrevibacter sp. TaxID=66852 RepID=UPI00388F816E
MSKEINIKDFVDDVCDGIDCKGAVFYSEDPNLMVDIETVIYEKLWTFANIKPSECKLEDNVEGWKTLAETLCYTLIQNYSYDIKNLIELPIVDDKVTYTTINSCINYANPKDVVNKIKGFLAHRELAPEQILYGLGLILDKSKETYITLLKQDLVEMKHQLKEVVNENNKFRERLNKAEKRKAEFPLKKKVVIVRNKVVTE